MNKQKILFVSDSLDLTTGFSVVTRNLIKILSDKYDCRCFCMVEHKPIRQFPIQYIHTSSSNLQDEFQYAINNFKPDLVISVNDIWRLAFMADVKIETPFRWLAYIPVEGENFPKKVEWGGKWINLSALLSYAESKIAYSNFGAIELEKVGIKVDGFVYHGVDTSIFRMRSESEFNKSKIKKYYFNLENDETIFLCVADNSLRKRYDLLIKAWAKYKKNNPDTNTVLILLTERIRNNGYDLDLLIKENDCEKSVYLIPAYKHGKGFPVDTLVDIYNISDFLVSTAGGEGFGLPFLEALSCGCNVIYPNYATPKEFLSDCENAFEINIRDKNQAAGTYTNWVEIDVDMLSIGFKNLVENSTDVQNSIDFAKQFDWKNFRGQWENHIIKALRKDIKVGVVV